MEFRSFKIK